MLFLVFLLTCIFSEHVYRVIPLNRDGISIYDALGLQRDSSSGSFLVPESQLNILRATSHWIIEDEETHENDAVYWTNEGLNTQLRRWAEENRGLASIIEVGKSELGVPLVALRLEAHDATSMTPRPIVRYLANIHGDEVVGRALLMKLIDHLITHSNTNHDIRRLLFNTTLEIMPTVNPDGFETRTRNNSKNIDLNRAFPDKFEGWNEDAPAEVKALLQWMQESPPTMVAMLHGGQVVCNYGRDGNAEHAQKVYTATPDDALMREVCREYARFNIPMGTSYLFDEGITNGANWYLVYGGFQDCVYDMLGIPSVTIEVSMVKWPDGASIDQKFWPDNMGSLIRFALKAQQGVFGHVVDAETGRSIEARFEFVSPERGASFKTSRGAFGRVLPVGSHHIRVTSDGYASREFHIDTEEGKSDVREIRLTLK